MTVPSPRETAVTALLSLVASAFAWKSAPARRLKMWTDVPKAARPACFLFEGGNESHVYTNGAQARRTIEVRLFTYIDASAGNGSTALNLIADALDAAFDKVDPIVGRNTLGGAVYWARIEGEPLKEPGDLDGDGLMVTPIRITLP